MGDTNMKTTEELADESSRKFDELYGDLDLLTTKQKPMKAKGTQTRTRTAPLTTNRKHNFKPNTAMKCTTISSLQGHPEGRLRTYKSGSE